MNHLDEENYTHKEFDNHYSWLPNLMESTTQFRICSRLSQRRGIQAGVGLFKEMKKRAPSLRFSQNNAKILACLPAFHI